MSAMYTCSGVSGMDHEEIVYTSYTCPLCDEIAIREAAEEKVEELAEEVSVLEDKLSEAQS